ncbi:hypothetical protein [Rubritalea sp.]|uniref:hypothetical protein n=1 Tax=Rubritalea sp. TaxID=2109375 RepID=UPI003EF22FA0
MKSHATLFRRYAQKLEKLTLAHQLFISIAKDDAGCDAVYIHSPNPHSEFPIIFDDTSWGTPDLQSIFSDFLPDYAIIAGEGLHNYVVYAEGVGEPLRPQN